MSTPLVRLCVALTILAFTCKADSDFPNPLRNCIVGAGAAGLQLGHFLKHANREYVIFERADKAGSFFRKYPRHRQLISLNKRNVRKERSGEFALRHDWNSLLDVRSPAQRTAPMTTRSKRLFPQADILAEYLEDFAGEQAEFIQYSTEVKHISKLSDPKKSLYNVTIERAGWKKSVLCQRVIVAGGFTVPRDSALKVDGEAHVEAYGDVPSSGESFEGKSVIIMGMGNAALETAQELMHYTSEVHVYARQRTLPGHTTEKPRWGVRLAYETHYVGDIRAGRTGIFDTYLLKSLDTFDYTFFNRDVRMVVIPCLGSKRCIFEATREECDGDEACEAAHNNGAQNLNYKLYVLSFKRGGKVAKRVRQVMSDQFGEAAEGKWEILTEEVRPKDELRSAQENARLGIQPEVFDGQFEELVVWANTLRSSQEVMDFLAALRPRYSSSNTREPIDHIIRCFGWRLDDSIFDPETMKVGTTHNGKYPAIGFDYQSRTIPGLYFAGTLAHGLDFRRSAGGFIHGFRYTARALFRLFEAEDGVAWPGYLINLRPDPKAAVLEAARLLWRRINEASGPYQMFQALGDMIVFLPNGTAQFMEEVPLQHFLPKHVQAPRLIWTFKYGKDFHGKAVLEPFLAPDAYLANASKFLHPFIQFFPAGSNHPSAQHWLPEDIFTQWDSAQIYDPLVRFVAGRVGEVLGDPSLQSCGGIDTELPLDEAQGTRLNGNLDHSLQEES